MAVEFAGLAVVGLPGTLALLQLVALDTFTGRLLVVVHVTQLVTAATINEILGRTFFS